MFLRRLVLENVRGIEHLELPLVDPDGRIRKWTVLLGENGCGKSTILRAIALLLAGSDALPKLLGAPDSWIRTRQKQCVIGADLATAAGKQRHIEMTIQRGDGIRDVFNRNLKTLDDLDQALKYSSRNYLTIGYGVSRRPSREKKAAPADEMGAHPRARSVATLFSADALMNPLETWAMDLHYRRGERGLAMVKRALRDLLPGVRFQGIDRERRELMFRTPDGLVPLSLLSDGYQNVAVWCGDLLYRITEVFADYKNPFSARGLLLIDEIDLHLHPVWQRQLMGFLDKKLPKFQIIATTHSPLTAQQAGEGELFVLRRPDAKSPPRIQPYPGAPRTLMVHQLLDPLFGVPTADSLHVEHLREEYRALRAKKARSLGEKNRLAELREELQDLPDWSVATPRDQRLIALLEEINEAMRSGTGTPAAPPEAGRKRSKRTSARRTKKR